jgi:hypothetical protein
MFLFPFSSSFSSCAIANLENMTPMPFLLMFLFPLIKPCGYTTSLNLITDLKKIFVPKSPFASHYKHSLYRNYRNLKLYSLCYNIARTYLSPPQLNRLRQPRLELGYRIHGSVFQARRVCPFTTGASAEGSNSTQLLPSLIFLNISQSISIVNRFYSTIIAKWRLYLHNFIVAIIVIFCYNRNRSAGG